VIQSEKLQQAVRLVQAAGVDCWLTFVRETAEGSDPVLPLIFEGGLTWQSALIVTKEGSKIAIVGNYDASPLEDSGNWDQVIPYVQDIRQELVTVLETVCGPTPQIAVNMSVNDVKADGLTHGMYLLLQEYLHGTRLQGSLVSAEEIVRRLRGLKTQTELGHMRDAIAETDALFKHIANIAKVGMSEREIYRSVQEVMDQAGFGYAWDRAGNPIVNCGPDSTIGHAVPSERIHLDNDHILHVDLGIIKGGYSSDIQRCWFVGSSVPSAVQHALESVRGAIDAGAALMKPGVQGWEVDHAARQFICSMGYPEYGHALGHQVGRLAHDGGTILGPKWARYGSTPFGRLETSEVYTLELGVFVDGHGYLGLEEMVVVTETGCEFLSHRQLEMPLIAP
jgi:Xaa-Pro aminopeptidase